MLPDIPGFDPLVKAIEKANKAAAKLLRCAESISNPVYSIVMDGKPLEILAVHHFQGQISIQVKSPATVNATRKPLALDADSSPILPSDVQR